MGKYLKSKTIRFGMIKKFTILLITMIFPILCFGVATTHDPWDGTLWDVTSPNDEALVGNTYKELYDLRKGVGIRMDKEHITLATSSAGGEHLQGSARAFFQDTDPCLQPDGTAFAATDLGMLWFDSNATPDNQFNVLTNHAAGGTWTPISTEIIAVLLASNRQFAGTLTVDSTLTVTGESTFNNHVNLGAGDDLIGSSTSDITINTNKFTVAGATGNTLVGGTLDVVGNFDPTAFETTRGGFIDEDSMATNSAVKASSQQSIKAYVDAQDAAQMSPTSLSFSSNPAEQSITYGNGLIFKAGYVAYGASTTITFGTAFPNAVLSINLTGVNATAVTNNAVTTSASTTAFTIKDNDSKTGHYWQAWGR